MAGSRRGPIVSWAITQRYFKPAGAEGAALVGHEKERRHCDPSFASSPAPPPERWPRASTRPRWPVDAKAPHKTANVFIHWLTRRRGRVGWGFDRRRDRRDAGGSLRSANHHIERVTLASARTKSKPRNPLNPRRPGRIPTHGKPESGAPARPVAHVAQACAKRQLHIGKRMAKVPTTPQAGTSNDSPEQRRMRPCPDAIPLPHRAG